MAPLFILFGFVVLVWQGGWQGVLVGAGLIGVMLLAVRWRG